MDPGLPQYNDPHSLKPATRRPQYIMDNPALPDLPPRGREETRADNDQRSLALLSADTGIVASCAESHHHTPQALSIPPEEPFKKFTLFPKLPAELRIKVWRYTFPEPRVVLLDYICRYETALNIRNTLGIGNVQTFPKALHVNQESREETLRAYYIIYHHPAGFVYSQLQPFADYRR